MIIKVSCDGVDEMLGKTTGGTATLRRVLIELSSRDLSRSLLAVSEVPNGQEGACGQSGEEIRISATKKAGRKGLPSLALSVCLDWPSYH